MKIWDNGKVREMTKKEIEEHNKITENAEYTEEKKDKFLEFIEKIAEADSLFDIVKIARELKNA